MTDTAASEALHARVRRFIEASLGGAPTEPFDTLACAIARFQAARVEPVARLFAAAGRRPDALDRAEDIVALPCEVFRLRRVAAHARAQDERCFESSGTTAGPTLRGRHPLRTLASYRLGALGWAARMLWPDAAPLGLLVLAPDEQQAPSSSLSFMLARFAEALSGPSCWAWQGDAPDLAVLRRAVSEARARGEPLLVAGTAFALVHLCDRVAPGSLPLPAGSRVMQTGGTKGRARAVSPRELGLLIAARFVLPESHVVGEYGMTELSSQLYQGTLAHALGHRPAPASATAYLPPPWVRVTAVDPVSLAPLADGEQGLCRIVDLANVDSAVGVLTADLVERNADGSIELCGRAAGAGPRGCSLALEHLVANG